VFDFLRTHLSPRSRFYLSDLCLASLGNQSPFFPANLRFYQRDDPTLRPLPAPKVYRVFFAREGPTPFMWSLSPPSKSYRSVAGLAWIRFYLFFANFGFRLSVSSQFFGTIPGNYRSQVSHFRLFRLRCRFFVPRGIPTSSC